MFTITFLTKRVPGSSDEDFFDHYRTTHYQLAARMPGLISYQQAALHHQDGAWALPAVFADYDALSIYTFDSREAADAGFASAEGERLNADTGTFIDWPSVVSLPADVTQRFDTT